jgi:Domain of unknown function (DUF4331)
MNSTKRLATATSAAAMCAAVIFSACDKSESSMENTTFTQVDRMGIPTLNTVFNHPKAVTGFSKTSYNLRGPESDMAEYKAQFTTVLGAVANDKPEETAMLLLPDELPVHLGSATSDFAKLDGRKLEDDAVDIALSVTVGSSLASLHSDHVDANDVAFLTDFPYLAAPQ